MLASTGRSRAAFTAARAAGLGACGWPRAHRKGIGDLFD